MQDATLSAHRENRFNHQNQMNHQNHSSDNWVSDDADFNISSLRMSRYALSPIPRYAPSACKGLSTFKSFRLCDPTVPIFPRVTYRKFHMDDTLLLAIYLYVAYLSAIRKVSSLRDFLSVTDDMTGTKSPKDFNMDNPLQAAGAARGIEASTAWGIEAGIARGIHCNEDIPLLARRDARPCVSTLTDETTTKVPKGHNFHNRRSATCGIGAHHHLCPKSRTYRQLIVVNRPPMSLPFTASNFVSGSSPDVHYRRSATCGYENHVPSGLSVADVTTCTKSLKNLK
jgi:hypothetical protein